MHLPCAPVRLLAHRQLHPRGAGGPADLKVGDTAQFKVSSTKQAANFYYEVVSRGEWSSPTSPAPPTSRLPLTPLMAPSARLLVYQILPTPRSPPTTCPSRSTATTRRR